MTPVQTVDDVPAIPHDLGGHDFTARNLELVSIDATKRWVHVPIAAETPNTYLVIIIDQSLQAVHGHLLDLAALYGLDAPDDDSQHEFGV